jgi:hypothetical protein
MKTILRAIFLSVTISFSSLSAQNQGPSNSANSENQPLSSCIPCSGAMWLNDQNVFSQNSQYTNVLLQNYLNCAATFCYWSRYLHTTNYNFSIPGNATVKGIELAVNGYASASGVLDSTIKLGIANSLVGNNYADANSWSTTSDTKQYGNSTDLWNYNWTPTLINNSNFGVFIKIYNSVSSSVNVYVDNVSVTVYYSLTTGEEQSQTSSGNGAVVYQSNNNLIINSGLTNLDEITLMDITGKNIESIYNATGATIINTGNYARGIYFVRMIESNKITTRKIILN